MKKLLTLFILAIIISLPLCALAKGVATPAWQTDLFVYDTAGILSPQTEQSINALLLELEKKTKAELVVASVSSLEGRDIEGYANEFFSEMGIGKKKSNNGLLLLISPAEPRVRVEVGYGLEGILNDAKCGRILDEFFVPHRAEGDYDTAASLTATALANVIATDAKATLDGADPSIVVSDDFELPIVGIIIVAVLLLSFGIPAFRGFRRGGLRGLGLALLAMSRSNGRDDFHGQGGFGGFGGGGGGFSGGGGGSSGGGGASR